MGATLIKGCLQRKDMIMCVARAEIKHALDYLLFKDVHNTRHRCIFENILHKPKNNQIKFSIEVIYIC